MSPTRMIIDTDPGIDDAMAILYAVASPEIELLGLTSTFGNVTTEIGTRNALQLLELAGCGAPVARGADGPLVRDAAPVASFVHGEEGLGKVRLPPPVAAPDRRPAAQFIIDMLRRYPGEVTLVPVGPLTNIALALRQDPEIAELAGQVIVMGGALRQRGNVTEYAEANIWHDPDAAQAVFDAPWPVTLVGLDVTERVRCTPADFAPMREISPRCGAVLCGAAEFYFAFHRETQDFDGCFLHDPTAVIAATHPQLFTMTEAPISVTCRGAQIGQTREHPNGAQPMRGCIGVEAEAVRRLFLDTLISGRLP